MAVKGKQREGFRQYTGLCDMHVVAINPTVEQLKELYKKDDVKLTEYATQTKEGEDRLRLDIYLRNEKYGILTKATIWLEAKLMQSKDGDMKQYLNRVGQTCWIEDGKDAPVWFKGDYRQAYLGEEALYRFLAAWTGIDPKDTASEIILDTEPEDLFRNDVAELQGLLDEELYGNQQVRVLLAIKDGKYQDVYTKVFLQAGSNYVTKLKTTLEQDRARNYPYKGDYQSSFAFQEFKGSMNASADDANDVEMSPEEALAQLQNQEAEE